MSNQRKETVAVALANAIAAWRNCEKSGNAEWKAKWRQRGNAVAATFLPSGSGVDNGTRIDWDASTGDRIVLHLGYHHMDEWGGYDGWTEHKATVTPSFIGGFDVRVGGRDRNGIKDYLGELLSEALRAEIPAA